MLLSNSGRVIVIDDDADEVDPLLVSLSKMGSPYCYFSGSRRDLPDEPIIGIRFVFLDIELDGFKGLNEKSIASALISILTKIVSPQNGPYVIVFWTKHQEYKQAVLDNCKQMGILPIACIDLDKSECKQNNYNNLSETIFSKLKEIGALLALVQWENIVHSASSEFFLNFSKLPKQSENWSSAIGGILNVLAESELGKTVTDNEIMFKSASRLLNQSFFDVLQRCTMDELVCPPDFLLQKTALEHTVIAQINNWLFIDMTSPVSIKAGSVFKCDRDDYIESIIESLESKDDTSTWTPVEVVITAECDIVCGKTLKTDKKGLIHRIVKGVLVPSNAAVKKDGLARVSIGPFLIDDSIVLLILHLGATSLKFESELGSYAYRLSRSLTFDIQAKTSSYLNRLGNGVIKG